MSEPISDITNQAFDNMNTKLKTLEEELKTAKGDDRQRIEKEIKKIEEAIEEMRLIEKEAGGEWGKF